MELVVLIIHLLVCVCLIGLVLLQRSEGGALGMGGGGGGSLMSGRGAADALARMTSVAGGFFLVTSLGLTVLSGASSASAGSSVLDNIVPRSSTIAPAAPAPAAPETTRPDPTESSAPDAAETRLASIMPGPAPAAAAPVTSGATRAGPLAATPTTTARTVPPPTTARSGATSVATSAQTPRSPPAATQRTGAATTPTTAPLILPNTSGSVTGIALTDDPTLQTESIEIGNGVEAVRRERAGPDQ